MSALLPDGDFPGLFEQDRQAARALEKLEDAVKHARENEAHEGWAARSRRLRVAATLANEAALELASVAGWNGAAAAAGTEGGAS